jgi:hypothetical protein
MINLPDDEAYTALPASFICPHCQTFPIYVEFDEWNEDGTPTEAGTHVSCTNEDDDHWSLPYVTLLPLEVRAHQWAEKNVRIVESESKIRERLRQWNDGEPIHV